MFFNCVFDDLYVSDILLEVLLRFLFLRFGLEFNADWEDGFSGDVLIILVLI
jgi:hypothetical protein